MNVFDAACGLCGERSRWQVQYGESKDDFYRHTGACSEHLAWACGLLQSASHIATVLNVWPTLG